MGGFLSRKVGSDPYYASYERSFESINAETDRLKVCRRIAGTCLKCSFALKVDSTVTKEACNLCRCRCTEGKAGRRLWATQSSSMVQPALLWLLLELLGYDSDTLPTKQTAELVSL